MKDILENYGTLSENNETSILDKILTTKEGKYDIEVREIYDGKLEKGKDKFNINLSGSYVIGVGDDFVGDYIVDEGCTWEEFFMKEFLSKMWDEFTVTSLNWWVAGGRLLIVDAFMDVADPKGPTFVNSEGEDVLADAMIESGSYSMAMGRWTWRSLGL